MDRKHLLRVSNYEYFISTYSNTGEYYKSPHAILAELEHSVCFTDNVPEHILIPYKDWGDCIFNFDRFYFDGNDKFAVFEFDTTCS